jgi:hypothetical protein
MTVSVTLVSENDLVLRLVHDFAHGLGCPVDTSGRSVRIEVDDDGHSLVELLTHVALSATNAGVDIAEPRCHVMYRHSGVTSNVTLTLRIADVRIDTATPISKTSSMNRSRAVRPETISS